MAGKKVPFEEEVKTWDRYQITQKMADREVARYVKEKKEKDSRQIRVDGVYQDPDDLDGEKEVRKNKQRKTICYCLVLAGAVIVLVAIFACFKLAN